MNSRLIVCVLVMSSWLSGMVYAADDKKIYRIGVEDINYYPIQDFKHEPDRGVIKDIMDAFSQQAGIEFEYIPLPIQRFYH